MKELSFEKMESINGGRCAKQAIIMYGSLIGTFASIPTGFGVLLGSALTAASYYDYLKCLELI